MKPFSLSVFFLVLIFIWETGFAEQSETASKTNLNFGKLEWLNPWLSSSNASGMPILLKALPDYTSFSDLKIRYDYATGEFGDPFTPAEYTDMGIQTKSIQRINNTFVMGYFNYSLSNRIDAQWNGLFVPGSNPFFIADSVKGRFRAEKFSAGVKVAHPIGQNQTIGFSVDYITATGAKDKDLRNTNTYNDFRIHPSWMLARGNLNLGASLGYNRTSETINYREVQTSTTKDFFYFYGNWFYLSEIYTQSSEDFRVKTDNAFEGNIQLQHTGKEISVYNQLGVEYLKGTQRSLAVNNRQFGDVESVLLKNDLVVYVRKNHRFSADIRYKTLLGFRHLQLNEFDPPTRRYVWVTYDRFNAYASAEGMQSLMYSFTLPRQGMDIRLQVDAGVLLFQRSQVHKIYPFDFRQTVSTQEFFVTANKNLKFGKSIIDIRPLIAHGIGGGNKNKVETVNENAGMTLLQEEWQLIAQRDHEFYALTCDRLRASLTLRYSYPINNRGTRLYVFGNYNYVKPLNHDIFQNQDRRNMAAGVGITF